MDPDFAFGDEDDGVGRRRCSCSRRRALKDLVILLSRPKEHHKQ